MGGSSVWVAVAQLISPATRKVLITGTRSPTGTRSATTPP